MQRTPDFNDLLSQFQTMRRMIPLTEFMKLIPGVASALPDDNLATLDRKAIDRRIAIIRSMTVSERRDPDLIYYSRKRRLADGSGTQVNDVTDLMVRMFEMRRRRSY